MRCARLGTLPKETRVWVAAPPSGGLEAAPPKTPQAAFIPLPAKLLEHASPTTDFRRHRNAAAPSRRRHAYESPPIKMTAHHTFTGKLPDGLVFFSLFDFKMIYRQ
jgi:hypothetical protein